MQMPPTSSPAPFQSILYQQEGLANKNLRQIAIVGILENIYQVLLKTVQDIKNNERLRYCHS